jgi:hypothetical protein
MRLRCYSTASTIAAAAAALHVALAAAAALERQRLQFSAAPGGPAAACRAQLACAAWL